jgi:hypothetical protein
LLRSLTALIAAYAFALQMMLAGVVATEMAAADPAAAAQACVSGAGAADKTGAPLHHGPCVVCAFASFSPPVPQAAEPAASRLAIDAPFAPATAAFSFESRWHDPQSARGPPRTA